MVKKFLNLTSGLEWGPYTDDPCYIRIQSTALEQKRWSHVLLTLGAEFLYSLATREQCVVYDCGARKPISRAIYQGIPWIRFVCQKAWKQEVNVPLVRGHNVLRYFENVYRDLPNSTLVEIKAYRKYVTGPLFLLGRSCPEGKVKEVAQIGEEKRLVKKAICSAEEVAETPHPHRQWKYADNCSGVTYESHDGKVVIANSNFPIPSSDFPTLERFNAEIKSGVLVETKSEPKFYHCMICGKVNNFPGACGCS